ncbi:glycosyltransferase family 4 protein [Candidatus Deferrimicrobium sp.]|uniref:glycosyltransferase family 4 protein n=1 Tax=Candidatus Deferrimicrobium sp. TaxID=3060586 RepID=UPI002720A705|nr:glycosyltransferase family 4 protein [Candidatus Deferrimicrobium sp.]MDO8738393.1 glycosyltransferase family 4 protein [Candidatus Deferrimicrobium sp.]
MTAPARPRVAVVVPKYGTIGGGERFVYELTERLARNGRYEIHVFANRWVPGPGPVVFHKIPRVPFPRFLRQALFAWFVGREMEKGGFDLVHAHDRIFRADVFTMHSIPHETWVRDIRKRRPTLFDRVTAWVERRMMEEGGCAWHLPVSSIAGEAYRERYRIDPSRMRVLHPGVDLARFSSPDRDACRREVRVRYGIGPSEVVILFVGMNFEVKGLDAVIEAVAKAKAVRADAAIRLLVVGKGNVGKYRSLASSLGIGGDVIFSGPVEKGVEEYYLASDLFMMLSAFDTFGMVVLEAMASRLPVIVSANVGAKDLVDEGLNGFVLPDSPDADAASGKILLLLDANRRVAMGEAGFRTASTHTWERLAGEVGKVYEEAIAERGPASGGTVA